MSEWKEYKLGDIANIQTGPFGSQLHKSDYKSTGIPCIMPCNITANLDICCSNIAYISEEDADRLCKHKTQKGDIIYSRRGDIEKCAYISEKESGWVCGTGCLKVCINSEKANSKFIAYQLSTPLLKSWIVGNAVGTTMLNLNTSILSECPISLPSLPTQQKIASILSSLDDKINVNRRINKQLEELAQALFKSWFVDFEPFKDGEFVESELGMIPKGWKVGKLGDVADVVMGSSPAGSSYNTEGNGTIFYQGRTDFGFRFPCVRMYTTEPKRFAEVNSVLLSVRAPVGDANIAFEKCCIGRGLASIKSNCNADSYTYYLIKSLKPILDNYNNEGTVFGCINKDALNNLSILVPTVEIIKDFENIVSFFDVEIRRRSEEITQLTTLRDTLLPKLMSGEIDVNEVEI